MTCFTRLARWTRILGCVFLVGWLAGCSAKQLFNEGMLDIKAGRWDVGLAKIEDAVRKDPDSAFFKTELRLKRAYVIQLLLLDADAYRAASRFTEARELYNHVQDLDRDNAQARAGLEAARTAEMSQEEMRMAKDLINHHDIKEARAQLAHILGSDPNNLEAKQLLEQLTGQSAQTTQSTQVGPPKPKLRPKEDRIASLDFRDTPVNMVFQALSRTTGLNFVLDKDVKGDAKTSIFLKDMPVESALDLVLAQHMLEKKVISENTVFIYPETVEKRRRFEEQVVKSFYLTNTDPKQAMNMLKVMLDTKVMFVDDRAKLLVMRDTPEVIRMAENLIASIDQEDSEVMMEVEVVEIQRTKLQELGVRYPNQIGLSALAPSAAAATTGAAAAASAASPLLLKDVFTLDTGRVRTSGLNATIDLRGESGQVNILASPRIRARNYEKAKILIGDRVPVITNAVTPTSAGPPVVTGSVQYLDVGLKFELEPSIFRTDEVAMKVNLEVSNIVKEVPNPQSGTLAYQIGTRTVATVLRLKDGETQILGGLISEEDRETASKIPGLSNIPMLGRLFQSQREATNKTEIVLSITPHIIRHGLRYDPALSQFWYGTETARGIPMLIKAGEANRNLQTSSKEVPVSTGLPPTVPAPGVESGGAREVTAPATPQPAATGSEANAAGGQPANLPPAVPASAASQQSDGAVSPKGIPVPDSLPPATNNTAAPQPLASQPTAAAGEAKAVGGQPASPPPPTPAPAASQQNGGIVPLKGATEATGLPPSAPALGAGSSTPPAVANVPPPRRFGRRSNRQPSVGNQPAKPSPSAPAPAASPEDEGATQSKETPVADSNPAASSEPATPQLNPAAGPENEGTTP